MPVIGSFGFAFLLMAAYSMLKPVRDAMASDWDTQWVSSLWTGTFFFSFVAVGFYSTLASWIRLKWLVPGVYFFFALTFITFYIIYTARPSAINSWLGYGYYMWVSVFALFHLSVFWSFMSQVYTNDQAVRLFAMIGTGISAGAIAGGVISGFFAKALGESVLVLIAASLLLVAIPLILYLNTEIGRTHDSSDTEHQVSNRTADGRFYDGFFKLVTTPQLLGIAIFILLLTGINAFAYFVMYDLLKELTPIREERAQILALRDLAINVATFVIGIFLTSRLVKRLGMKVALPLVPVAVAGLLLVVAGIPAVFSVIAFEFVRKVGNYSITRPSREMLFTKVDSAARFQTKPVIDVICYRGGDVTWAWVYTAVTVWLGASITQAAILGAGFALVWAGVGIWLGVNYQRAEREQDDRPKAASLRDSCRIRSCRLKAADYVHGEG